MLFVLITLAALSPGYGQVSHSAMMAAMEPQQPGADEHQVLLDLAREKMPFGRYAGHYLIDLPEAYVLWFKHQGFPQGRIGYLLENLLEIKANGLEPLVRKLR